MCPNCGHKTDLVSNSFYRKKYCLGCDTYRHRDIMAGHNIAHIVMSQVQGHGRPEYLPVYKENSIE